MKNVRDIGVQKSDDNGSRLIYRAPYCDLLMMARLNTKVSKKLLEVALSKARTKYLLLNSRILQDNYGNTEFVYDYNQDFSIKEFENKSESDWLNLAWNEQKIPFNLMKGPLIKFLLIDIKDSTDLVIICHHCICDGLSLTYLIKDIAAFLDNPNAIVQPLSLPPAIAMENLSVNVSLGFVGLVIKMLAKSINRSWNKNKIIFAEQDYEHLYREYWKTKDIGLFTLTISKETTVKLIEKCRMENVTVNSALTTAFSFAQYSLQGNRQPYLKKALLPFNIRHLFKNSQEENFGFLAIVNEIRLPSGKGDFWSNARKFNIRIKEMLSNPAKSFTLMTPLAHIEPTLFDAIYFAESGSLKNKTAIRFKNIVLSKTGKPKRSLDITNLGVVKDFSSNLRTIFFVPILSANYEKILGIVTVNGEINMVIMHDRSVIDHDIILEFKKRIFKYINESF